MHWHGAFKTFQSWPRSLYGGLLHRAILSGDLNIEILTAHLFIGKICNFTLAAQEKEWMWPISETGCGRSQPKAWTTITTKFHAHCHNCWLGIFVWYIGSEKWPGDQMKIVLDDWAGPDLYLFTADGVYFRFCKKYHGDVHIPIMQAISRGFGGIGNVQRQGPIFYSGKGLCTSPVLPKELSSDRNKSNGKIENVEKRKSQWKESFYLLAGTPWWDRGLRGPARSSSSQSSSDSPSSSFSSPASPGSCNTSWPPTGGQPQRECPSRLSRGQPECGLGLVTMRGGRTFIQGQPKTFLCSLPSAEAEGGNADTETHIPTHWRHKHTLSQNRQRNTQREDKHNHVSTFRSKKSPRDIFQKINHVFSPVLFPPCQLCVGSSSHTHGRCRSSGRAEPPQRLPSRSPWLPQSRRRPVDFFSVWESRDHSSVTKLRWNCCSTKKAPTTNSIMNNGLRFIINKKWLND